MADVSALRSGIKTRLATIANLRTYDVMPGKIELPGAAVALRSAEFDRDMDGNTLYRFYIWIYVQASSDLERAQRALDVFLAPSGALSIKAAVEGDQSLGGIADWVRVTGWSDGPRLVDVAGTQPLAIAMDCEVMAD